MYHAGQEMEGRSGSGDAVSDRRGGIRLYFYKQTFAVYLMLAYAVVFNVVSIISDANAYGSTPLTLLDEEYRRENIRAGAIAIVGVVGGAVAFVLRCYKTSLAFSLFQ